MMSKRAWTCMLSGLLLSGAILSAPSTAAAAPSYGYMDMKESRTYVPIRYLSEQLKYSVNWDAKHARIQITQGQTRVELTVGSSVAKVNGEQRTLDAAPFAKGGVTYVPIRFVAEAMKLELTWDSKRSALLFQGEQGPLTLPVVSTARQVASNPIQSSSRTIKAQQRSYSIQLVEVDLLHPKVSLGVGVANGKIGSVASLKHMAEQNGAAVAMNGTFFDAYTSSDVKVPYGYIVQGGKIVHKSSGDKRSMVVFTKNNQIELIDGKDFQARFDAGDVDGALQAGPRLVRDGQVAVDPVSEGFKDPKILTNGGARSAIGITKDQKLLLVTVPSATIPQLAHIMKQAGAYQAMNLDGGASSGLYVKGRYATSPGRALSNSLLVFLQK
ncbi:phosphodiester glycosidase family protein [Paenibacillus aquistagni]|uniref:Copper amine oxidase N-terminal domain-containing protein n=1 Tax=Paenibacillus aquistagni TaxID=1852522 RepID=A0A1X7LPL7_9BACL|nr:phosphodiester glycosidase family protein [Paenibacillus aquistagni]SMG55775.1 Copper amine oxidase N-terminal domain-containing protein [Paenibacillus aquistagni]